MAFHRHTGKVDVLLVVVGDALCVQCLLLTGSCSSKITLLNAVLSLSNLQLELMMANGFITSVRDWRWERGGGGGLIYFVKCIGWYCFCICCWGKAGAQLLFEED